VKIFMPARAKKPIYAPSARARSTSAPSATITTCQDLHAGRSKEACLRAVREHVPPDTTAAIFWLKNRNPAHWRDAWQLEHVTGKYPISDKPMTEEQWIRGRGDRPRGFVPGNR
jgi:hypothetical protein